MTTGRSFRLASRSASTPPTHTQIGVSSNGYLTFGSDLTDYSNDLIPSATDPDDLIAPLWDDLNPAAGGTIHYQTRGTAPDRRLIVQWTNVPQYGKSDSNTFQVLLFESTGCIEFRYGSFTPESPAGDYTIGLENQDGTAGVSVPLAMVTPDACLSFCIGTGGEHPTRSGRRRTGQRDRWRSNPPRWLRQPR